jgi:hypothetical protein
VSFMVTSNQLADLRPAIVSTSPLNAAAATEFAPDIRIKSSRSSALTSSAAAICSIRSFSDASVSAELSAPRNDVLSAAISFGSAITPL